MSDLKSLLRECRPYVSGCVPREHHGPVVTDLLERIDAILAAEPSPVDAAAREKELRDLARLTCVRCFDGHPHTDVSMMFHANGIMPTVHDYCPARFIHQALAAKEEADADAE